MLQQNVAAHQRDAIRAVFEQARISDASCDDVYIFRVFRVGKLYC